MMSLVGPVDSDDGDPLWVPRTYIRQWPASVPEKHHHLLSPELLAIQRAREASRALRRDPKTAPLVAAAWRIATRRANLTGMPMGEQRYMAIQAEHVLALLEQV